MMFSMNVPNLPSFKCERHVWDDIQNAFDKRHSIVICGYHLSGKSNFLWHMMTKNASTHFVCVDEETREQYPYIKNIQNKRGYPRLFICA